MVVKNSSIFGKNDCERIQNLWFDHETAEEAREVLDSIQHPEMSKVLKTMEEQMEAGHLVARYGVADSVARVSEYLSGEDQSMLFTDRAYFNGLNRGFLKLLERVHPEYHSPGQPVLEMVMERRD
tara:strand:- start:551 stop:925 length:375 start_codon:yes stop_codon:yes gene_type:complete